MNTKKIMTGIGAGVLLLASWVIIAPLAGCATIKTDYTSAPRPDGGVSLHITGTKQYWMPLTPEGPFPRQKLNFDVEVIGKGTDWSYSGQDGYYYGTKEIECKNDHWDVGYAWVDKARRYIHFNLHWVSAPNRLKPSDLNGKYRTDKRAEPPSAGDVATRAAPEK